MNTCPSEQTLALLGTDHSLVAGLESLELHIEHCASCQEVLERLAREFSEGKALGSIRPPAIPDFEIGGELGRGGSSVVFEAWQISMARPVAIKFFRDIVAGHERVRKQWLREARANARVVHPNVVVIHDAGETDGRLFLVQQLIKGGSLRARLESPLRPEVAARLMKGVAEGVHAIHENGLNHLDLKPSNILLDTPDGVPWENATPRITDFGISRVADEPSGTHSHGANPWGTPWYMAPEQSVEKPEKIGTSCDIYAIGATLYHLLTGRAPFQAATVFETLEQVRNDEPVAPRKLNRSIPIDLETICLACLEKDPAKRYQGSAKEVADDLQRWLDGKPIKARPISKAGRLWKTCRRHPSQALLILGLVLAIGVGLAGTAYSLALAEVERRQTKLERIKTQASRQRARAYEENIFETVDRLGSIMDTSMMGVTSFDEKLIRTTLDTYRKTVTVLANAEEWEPMREFHAGRIERAIATGFAKLSDFERARTAAISSIRHSEVLWPEKLDPSLRYRLAGELATVHSLVVGIDLRDRRTRTALEHAKSAIDYLVLYEFQNDYYSFISGFYADLKRLHRVQAEAGDAASTAEIDQLSLRLLQWMSGKESRSPNDSPLKSLSEWERAARDRMLEVFHSKESVNPHGDEYKNCLWHGWWLLADDNPFREDPDSAASRAFAIDPKPYAERLVKTILSLRSRSMDRHDVLYEVVETLMFDCGQLGPDYRRAKQYEKARLVSRQLTVIADTLVAAFPDSAEALYLRANAHCQHSKDAWKSDDYPAIERETQLAIEDLKKVVELDPEFQRAGNLLGDLKQRLSAFQETHHQVIRPQ